ncbi:hypothetical protein NKI15_19990 [Mesorhizobium sp. M0862]|uniref:hypothetical protein n=1 Tax=Mesorhizobium sp. M0862 TaxID=2957015 RepID=UPI003339C19C
MDADTELMRLLAESPWPVFNMARSGPPSRKAINQRRYRKRDKVETVMVTVPVSLELQTWLIEQLDPRDGGADRAWLRGALLGLISQAVASALPVTRETHESDVESDQHDATGKGPTTHVRTRKDRQPDDD